MKVTIKNIMQVESLELDLAVPFNIIAGVNEAGKSTIRDAMLWGFTGQARGLKTHADQAALIREGAKSGEVTISMDGTHAFTRRKTQKTAAAVLGDIPDIGLNPAILFDPLTFLSQSEDERRALLFKVIPGLHPTEQNVFDRLCYWPAVTAIVENTMDETRDSRVVPIIKSVATMAASHGFPGAEKEAVIKRREAKRVRDTYKDATEPEKTITIDGQEFDIPTLNLPAIEATLKDLQQEKDDLLRQKGAGEARVKRLGTIQGQLDKIGVLVPPDIGRIGILERELSDTSTSLKKIEAEIKQMEVQLRPWEEFPAICPVISQQIPCPKAGERLGQDPPDLGILETLHQNRTGLYGKAGKAEREIKEIRRQNEEYQNIRTRKATLEDEQTRLSAESEAVGIDYDTEIATRQRRIDRGQAFQVAVASYNIHLAQYQITQEKLAAAEQEVIIYDALQKALAPDGIPSQMIAEALDGINELLEEAAGHLFNGRYLHLNGELGIVLQSSPYQTLSKSAKYRVGVAFQYALSRLTGARILLIDEADILDDTHQAELINFFLAKIENFDQVIVFMTAAEPPRILIGEQRLQTWWLDKGVITKYGQV